MNRLRAHLDRFWFTGAPANRLALLRILVGLYVLTYLVPRFGLYSSIARSSRDVFEPVGIIDWLGGPISPQLFQVILVLTLVANLAFVLGLYHRVTGPVFAGLLLWLLSYRNSWSKIYHTDDALVLHVLILALAPAADALSLDAVRRGPLSAWRTSLVSTGSGWQYGYPIRLICAVTVLTYFIAGVTKVAGPLGWTWATGEALRSQVGADGLRKELYGAGAPWLTFRLYEHIWIFAVMGIGTLVLELGAPLALLNKRIALVWAAGAFMMHWGVFFVMGIVFNYHQLGVIFASFFDLERVAAGLLPGRIAARLGRWRGLGRASVSEGAAP